jgi:hypothetical protein
MADSSLPGTSAPAIDAGSAERIIKRIALIGLLSIALGIGMQLLILVCKLAAGASFPGAQLIVDMTQGVTWAFFVCSGIGIGTAIIRARAALVGLLGAICAPIGMAFAKSSQKAVGGMLGMAEQPAILSLLTIGTLRAIEYGILGWMLGVLASRGEERATRFLSFGAYVGLGFGITIALITYYVATSTGAPMPLPRIVAVLVNEVVFPIGCAFVVYVGVMVGKNMKFLSA